MPAETGWLIVNTRHDAVYTAYEFEPPADQPIILDRCIIVTCSEDARLGVPVSIDQELASAAQHDLHLLAEPESIPPIRGWDRADVEIDGDDTARFFVSRARYDRGHDLRVSIDPREVHIESRRRVAGELRLTVAGRPVTLAGGADHRAPW